MVNKELISFKLHKEIEDEHINKLVKQIFDDCAFFFKKEKPTLKRNGRTILQLCNLNTLEMNNKEVNKVIDVFVNIIRIDFENELKQKYGVKE